MQLCVHRLDEYTLIIYQEMGERKNKLKKSNRPLQSSNSIYNRKEIILMLCDEICIILIYRTHSRCTVENDKKQIMELKIILKKKTNKIK